MRAAALVGALIAVAALVAVVIGVTRDDADDAAEASFALRPLRPGGPLGLVARAGERWRLVVWGLEPSSRHRVELGRSCEGGRPVAVLDANANGVAYGTFAAQEDGALLVRSSEGPTAVVACGPRGEPAAAELSAAGPGAAARTDGAAGLLQLGEGAPPVVVRARAGRAVALAVRSRRPGELRVDGLGLAVQVGPGTIARLAVVPPRAGAFPIRFAGATVGRLVVRGP